MDAGGDNELEKEQLLHEDEEGGDIGDGVSMELLGEGLSLVRFETEHAISSS